MTRHRRLQQRIRNSPARRARQRHHRAQRLDRIIGMAVPFGQAAAEAMYWLLPVIRLARPKGPKYAEGDCRRNPDWRRRG